jgi:tetraacyldisaccharide 4'-kinase
MERWLTQNWYRSPGGASLLAPLGWLYGSITAVRRQAYASGLLRSHAVGKPVIVVGNLSVGGTGKTPVVAWLAERLSAEGVKVGIVSRGHGRSTRDVRFVHDDADWREVGDEPLLLRRLTGCDTVVAIDRVAGARHLVRSGADLVICDDGLQHLRLARDCEIVVIDGARGFGNGRLLPAGPLREPASRIRKARLVIVNGVAEHPSLNELPDAFQMVLSGNRARRLDELDGPVPLEHFRGKRVHAVAGIGHPERFFRHLSVFGMDVVEHAFPDHHPFAAADLEFGDQQPVLMTQKDAVKCRSFAGPRLWYVPVVAHFAEDHGRKLLDRVAASLAPISTIRGT